jgi:hypothetical protein
VNILTNPFPIQQGAKESALMLISNHYCPCCDGYGYFHYNFGDQEIEANCEFCNPFELSDYAFYAEVA